MGRGQSLIVWAIAEGRAAAAAVDRYLMGHSALPAPISRPPRRSVGTEAKPLSHFSHTESSDYSSARLLQFAV